MHPNRKNLALQLCKAVNDGEPRAVEALLLQGANPNLVLRKGVAAVHLAVGKETEKRIRCLKLLLQHGADPNVRSVEDLTPLHVAALWGCYQNLKLLLQNGGNPGLEDQDGNKPADLANQQENRKCAQLLKDYLPQDATEAEDGEERPRFQYSLYHGQDSGASFSLSGTADSSAESQNVSLLSDIGEGPFSSTQRSSFLNLSGIGGRLSRPRLSGLSDVSDLHVRQTLEWDRGAPDWGAAAPSVLTSTRISTGGPREPCGIWPILEEGVSLVSCGPNPLVRDGRPVGADPLQPDKPSSSRRVSRKSVSFRDVDEYFPVFNSVSPGQLVGQESRDSQSNSTVDLSDYSEFLSSDRMTTVLYNQGIDVTSPDHVFVFSRDARCSSLELDETVVGHVPIEGEEEGDGGESENLKDTVRAPCSSGSSSSGSRYSSCESEPYTSAIEASLHHRHVSPEGDHDEESALRAEDEGAAPQAASVISLHRGTALQQPLTAATVVGTDALYSPGKGLKNCLVYKGHARENASVKESVCSPFLGTLPSQSSTKPSKVAPEEAELPTLVNSLMLSPKTPLGKHRTRTPQSQGCAFSDDVTADGAEKVAEADLAGRGVKFSTKAGDATPVFDREVPLTPSPFVTGRTRSRLSRCSFRTNSTSNLLHYSSSSSSLFEESLPTPVRLHRRKTKARDRDATSGGVPNRLCHTPNFSLLGTDATLANTVARGCWEGQTSTLTAGGSLSSQEGDSQADTQILSGSMADTVIISGSVADTVILEKEGIESVTDTLLNDHAKTWPDCPNNDVVEGSEFLTDDLSSSNDEGSKERIRPASPKVVFNSPKPRVEESWIAGYKVPQSETVTGTRPVEDGHHCTSPEPQKDLPASSGCTPRYSLSRLSAHRKSHGLANPSYTQGGLPLVPIVDEPVEYLYTDIEQGHELIECHVPPTANTTLSSDLSTTTSEETVLYDWRSLQLSAGEEKENHKPQEEVLPGTGNKGLTDKELRRRLKEHGEDSGPITHLTRTLYMQKLERLQQEPKSKQPAMHNPGYSVELAVALHTFTLPDCQAEELAMCQQFDQPDQNRKWREGIIKSSFNYLLLDPRVTKNLPYRSSSISTAECFQVFINAIFYVGKGKRSRPYSHLYEALEYYRGDKTSRKMCSKLQHILQVWKAGQGVVSLHCFQNVIPVEAYTREACMVDAIGLKMLTNQKRGDYYGVVATWPMKRRREMGVRLLYRAMQIFLAEGERQLRPPDIQGGH